MTPAALEEQLPSFNDMPFLVDDLQTVPGNESARYSTIRNTTYAFSDGKAKARSSSSTIAITGDGTWRSILVTSSEHPIDTLAKMANKTRDSGELARLIDVPVAGKQGETIFDVTDKASDSRWKTKMFRNSRKNTRRFYGTPFERYIVRLAKLPKAGKIIERHVKAFKAAALTAKDDDIVRDIAGKFALMYAGGCLAIKFKTVPWHRKRLLRALLVSYVKAKAFLPVVLTDEQQLQAGKDLLKSTLNGLPSFKNCDDKCIGYKSDSQYVILRDSFNDVFETVKQRKLVLDWLVANRRIVLAQSKKSETPEPQSQFLWPNKTRKRSYKISFSRLG